MARKKEVKWQIGHFGFKKRNLANLSELQKVEFAALTRKPIGNLKWKIRSKATMLSWNGLCKCHF